MIAQNITTICIGTVAINGQITTAKSTRSINCAFTVVHKARTITAFS